MSTEQQQVTEQVQYSTLLSAGAKTSPGFTSLGKCLQQARIQAGFSVQQIAIDMHLDARLIEYIEQDRFSELGAPVFIKGHLRRYARLVNVDETLLHGLYESLRDIPVAVDPIPSSVNNVSTPHKLLPDWVLWTAVGLFAVASIATMVNKLVVNTNKQTVATNMSKTSIQSTANKKITPSAATAVLSTQTTASTEPESKSSTILNSIAPVASVNAHELSDTPNNARNADPRQVTLTLKFSGDSWVEVYDANKHAVLFDMGHNSSTRQVTGIAPLNVLIGAVPQVTLQINGHDVAIPAKRIVSSVARFAVDVNGTIN